MNRFYRPFLLLCLWCIVSAGVVIAQSKPAPEASLTVTVNDPTGAAIVAARLSLTINHHAPLSAVTNKAGEATFVGLVTGKYILHVEADGFAPREWPEFKIKTGNNKTAVTLQIAQVVDELLVKQDKQEANTDPRGDAFTTVLTGEQLALLPDDPEEFEDALRSMAGPGAVFRVNGFRGGKLPPKSQIREIRFRTNPYAAENHDPGFISVDVFTKPGVNTWHGSMNIGFRDESLNARNAFAPFRGAEQDRRYGAEFSGPLWKNHTSLFGSVDGMNSYDTKTIVAALPTGNFADLIRRPARRLNLQARVEHALNKTHTLRGEYQRNANRQENLGVGNFDLADRAFTSDSTEHIFRLSDSGAMGKKIFNELRLQATWRDIGIRSLSDARTIRVLDAFTIGGAQIASDNGLREIELADNFDLAYFKKHALRAGFMWESGNYDSTELRNQNGTFTFASLADFRANRPLQFSQRSGAPAVTFQQHQFGWFLQDEWRVRKNFSLNFGVRHEIQTNLRDRNNFSPRLGLAWSPFKNGKTTVRAGAGIFYDWFDNKTLEQILRVNGQRQNDLIVRNPGFPDPFSGGTAVTLPPSVMQQATNLRMPYVLQSSFGLERELPHDLKLTANYSYTRGVHQLRGININQPVPGLGRPFPTQGNITQIASIANSYGHMLMLAANWHNFKKHLMASVNYRLAKMMNETDSAFSLPVNSFDLRAERGAALSDYRHLIFGMATFPVYKMLRGSMTFNYLSALPYNITTGLDNNNDAVINDRPAGVTRNSARGAGQINMATRLSWGFGWGKLKEQAGATPQVRIVRGEANGDGMLGALPSLSLPDKRFRTEFYVQASNVINHANLTNFIGVQTSPFFGRATAAMPGRRIETGMRFSF